MHAHAHICTYMHTYVHIYTCDLSVPVRIIGIDSSADNCLILEENNTLTCVSTGVPQPTIQWFIRDIDNVITESSNKYTLREDQLIISDVSYSDTNVSYGCSAHNIADGVMEMDNITKLYPACSKQCLPCICISCSYNAF